MKQETRIEISQRTIFITLGVVLALWLVFQIRDILFLLFIAFLLMTALHPVVVFLQRFRVPRLISIVITYAVIFGFFGVSLFGAIPGLVAQTGKLVQQLPQFATRVLPYWNIDLNTFTQELAPIGENLVRVTLGLFSNIITTVTVLVFTFYFLLERRHADSILSELFGDAAGRRISDILRAIERRLGAWVRGELFLMAFVGVLSYIGLTLLRVEFALPLAIFAGLLEIVPIIGPIVSAVPAVLVALATSPLLALSVVALYFIVQQVENNVLVPFVMNKSVGLSPLITILSLMIGGRLAGITGVVLAVPVVLVLQVLVTTFIFKSDGDKSTKNPLRRP